MRTGISIALKPADRRRLTTLARDRNAPHKHVWRAEISLMNADGVGTRSRFDGLVSLIAFTSRIRGHVSSIAVSLT
jgi:hypothetical protein